MLQKRLIPIFCAATLFSISAHSSVVEITQDEMNSLDKGCELIDQKLLTKKEASACVTPFYNAAVKKSFEIKEALEQSFIANNPEVLAALHIFKQTCEPNLKDNDFDNYSSAEDYLRAPMECLALLSDEADNYNVDYDYDGASFLHGRLRLLRRLDFQP